MSSILCSVKLTHFCMIEHICCVLVKEVEVNFDKVFKLSGWRLLEMA
jgi:hypothetical protein